MKSSAPHDFALDSSKGSKEPVNSRIGFAAKAGMDRQTFVSHLKQEGYELYRLAVGYVEPLHLLPLFQKPREFRRGYPWSLADGERQQSYAPGLLPVTERLHTTEMLVLSHIYPPLSLGDLDRIADAFAAAAGA